MFETIHLVSLVITAPFILYADHMGLLYILGKKKTLPENRVKAVHTAVIIGLFALIISGIFLVLPAWRFYLADLIFQVKICFVGALVINGLFIHRLMDVAYATPFKELTNRRKLTLLVSGGVSSVSWVSAALIGFFVL